MPGPDFFKETLSPMAKLEPLSPDTLSWRCDPASLGFETTKEVSPAIGFAGQEAAIEALRFGIECDAPEQNAFVRGLTGTGRMSIVRRMLDELESTCDLTSDFAYVHDWTTPDRPRLLTLPAGRGRALRREVRKLAQFIREDMPKLLSGEAVQSQRHAIEAESAKTIQKITQPFDEALREAGLAMVQQNDCLLYTSPSPRDQRGSRMPSSA